jgi:hypothetical protein
LLVESVDDKTIAVPQFCQMIDHFSLSPSQVTSKRQNLLTHCKGLELWYLYCIILQLWMHESLRMLSFTVCCGNKTFVNLCNNCTEHDFTMKYLMKMSHFWIQLYWKQVLLAFIVFYKLSESSLIKFCVLICAILSYGSPLTSHFLEESWLSSKASDLYSGGSQFDSCPEHRLFMVFHCSSRQMPG